MAGGASDVNVVCKKQLAKSISLASLSKGRNMNVPLVDKTGGHEVEQIGGADRRTPVVRKASSRSMHALLFYPLE